MMRRSLLTCSIVLVAGGFGLVGRAQVPQSEYRILVTNDDGIDSPGVAALVVALGENAEVVLAAPSENRSATSHATESLSAPTRVVPYRIDGRLVGYAVSGTPADATRFGLLELGKEAPFDLVVSGINQGENVGLLAHLSGTVGAAKEALYLGVPAIAVSQSRRRGDDYATAAQFTARIVEQVRARGLPTGVLLSINVPGGDLRGAVAARMSGSELRFEEYVEDTTPVEGAADDARLYRLQIGFQRPSEGGDTRAFLSGFITVTPLRLDWTDYDALAELAGWDLGLR